uniref:Uncharacterized protein n=1 Tax=Stegastes partitus TaxID=144197 RepID=A0A3B5BE44_9TELE
LLSSPVAVGINAYVNEKKRGQLLEEAKKVKGKTRVRLRWVFSQWRKLPDLRGLKTNNQLTLFLLDQYLAKPADILI